MGTNFPGQFPWSKTPFGQLGSNERIDLGPMFRGQPGSFLDHNLGMFLADQSHGQSSHRFWHLVHQSARYLQALIAMCWRLTSSQPDFSSQPLSTPSLRHAASLLFVVAQRFELGGTTGLSSSTS